jgi:hypothetical protein
LATSAVWVFLSGAAVAAPIDLELDPDGPDVLSAYISVSYDADGVNATTGLLTADGTALAYRPGPQGTDQYWVRTGTAYGGDFRLAAQILSATGVLVGGDLDVDGEVPDLFPGYSSGQLLDGALALVGFPDPPGGRVLEFFFGVTGTGDAVSDFGGVGHSGGVILNLNEDVFDGTWDEDFATVNAFAYANTGVPEPATGTLLLVGLLALAASRRARA